MYKTILALDPSGNFYEGKGTTGWCIFDCVKNAVSDTGYIAANNYNSMEEYWHAHIKLIDQMKKKHKSFTVVIEDYLLYQTKLDSQIHSRMETPKLIGLLQYYLWMQNIPYYMQTASEVKKRWSDEVLLHKQIITPLSKGVGIPKQPRKLINRHCKDSIRHAVHYNTFYNKEK